MRQKEYIDALFEIKIIRDKVKKIQSKLHKIGNQKLEIGNYVIFKISWFFL